MLQDITGVSDPKIKHQVSVILNWDLGPVKARMRNKLKISAEEVDALELEYKRYLALCAIYRDSFPISGPVDEMWHAHLIHSPDYEKMERIAGRRFIHMMTQSKEEDEKLLPLYKTLTIPRYAEHFGQPDAKYWPAEGCVCLCCDCVEEVAA